MEYEAVIGLEVHAQLLTKSKIFCGCATTFGEPPNTQTCPVCLGMPGVLPVLNRRAVEFALKMALATNCEIAPESVFARKNYFYPDLPKGYQISMYELPLAEHGYMEIQVNGERQKIGITRIHLEEDAGKLIHSESRPVSFVDFNRTGVPLIEIVSEPDMRTPEAAAEYLKALRNILLYLEICDGNMEEGDDVRGLAQLTPAAPRHAVELDHAAVFLQAARIGLLDEEVRVVLDRHGDRKLPTARRRFREVPHIPSRPAAEPGKP